VLFILSFPLLIWNETRAFKATHGLAEAGQGVVALSADHLDPANDDQLVHVTGLATTEDTLRDPLFGVADRAIQLLRLVEMYQWIEQQTTAHHAFGGERTSYTYTYQPGWSATLIDSGKFNQGAGHQNPPAMPYPSWKFSAERVSLGAFRLSADQTRRVHHPLVLPVDQAALSRVAAALRGNLVVGSDGRFYRGNPAKPQIGDVRISFQVTRPMVVSVLAKQAGNTLEPYRTRGDDPVVIDELRLGTVSAAEMLGSAQTNSRVLTWILRVCGLVLMGGVALVFKPLVGVADAVPYVGELLQMGLAVFTVVVTLTLGLTTIALTWLAYRPLQGMELLGLAAAMVIGTLFLVRKRRARKVHRPRESQGVFGASS